MEIQLPLSCLAEAMAVAPIHDFTLIVGGEQYPINKFAACVLSPKIGTMLKTDPTLSRLSLATPDPSHLFPHLLSLLSGAKVSLDGPVGVFLAAVVVEIGNRDLINAMCLIRDDTEPLDVANVVPRLLRRFTLGLPIPDSELDFAASHFLEFESDIFSRLGVPLSQELLAHPNLAVESEDGLLDLILRSDMRILLEFVQCQFLSDAGVARFAQAISLDEMNVRIWDSVRDKLQGVRAPSSHRFFRQQSLVFRADQPFNGIVANLARECGGNPHDRGLIHITASGTANAGNPPSRVIDYQWPSQWTSTNVGDSWWCVEFKQATVSLTHYSVKLFDYGGERFQHWVIEGSDDGTNWRDLDRRSITDLGPQYFQTYTVASCGFYHFIRMRQTGPTQLGHHYFPLTNIEFFGTLRRAQE